MMRITTIAAFVLTVFLSAACSKAAPDGAPIVTVYKSPTCQCCSVWIEHLKQSGFATRVEAQRDLAPVRTRLGVPATLAACHTAVVNGYLVEGHVPAEDIRRLLAEKPNAKGIAVPGMPVGSPGMEMGERHDPYEVLLFDGAGETQVFARHGAWPTGADGAPHAP
ncbi:MAG: DUF411 domain-containing protein [Sinimarinibacterium sp.]|jgi:hypothetical protein